MVEKSFQISGSPEVTDSKDGSLRRISMGSMDPLNRTDKIVPHYLRASTGSCHDFCKYGRKHAFEAKEKLPTRKGIKVTPNEDHSLTKTVTQGKRKVKPMVQTKLSPDAIAQVPGTPLIKPHSETVKPVVQPPMENIDVTGIDASTSATREKKPVPKHRTPPDQRIKVSGMPKMIQKEAEIVKKESSSLAIKIDADAKTANPSKLKPVKAASGSFSLSVPGDQTDARNSAKKKVYNTGTSKIGQKKALAQPRISLSVKPSISRVGSLNTRKYRTSKTASPKNEDKARTAEARLLNEEKISEKTLYVIEPKPEIKSLEASTGNVTWSSLSSPSSSLSSSVSTSLPSSSSISLHEEEEDEDSESTLEEAENDYLSEHDETEEHSENLKDEYKKKLRRAASIHPENDDLAWKLKFRRGKVVDLPSEKSAPRRLKFRKGRILGDDQNGRKDLGRKSFKQREVVDTDTNSPGAGSEKVVLKHQDANEKKDSQGLLNNVIEETASKLVETRKSKVKALVGAFETVISLQDR